MITTPPYTCGQERRRELVRAHPTLNGIDYLEVNAANPRQLDVEFVKAAGLGQLAPGQFQLVSARGDVAPRVVEISQDARPTRLQLLLSDTGGSGRWTLMLAAAPGTFDPLLSAVNFRFQTPATGDCGAPVSAVPRVLAPAPDIDYLAKDYASFRRLMLDRLGALVPGWTETHPADLGVTLVELLAYVADRLSYTQDAIATEASLGTARRRVSVRRHARLVDYPMHDGCNARAWVQVQVGADTTLPTGTRLLTQTGSPASIRPADLTNLLRASQPEVFETLHPVRLSPTHNSISFYTWGDEACCLPAGAMRATLRDDPQARLHLSPGDVLIFEETLGPRTGVAADANPAKRYAVRLTSVTPAAAVLSDNGGNFSAWVPGALVTDPLTGQAIVEIEWAAADALPTGLCISAVREAEHGGGLLENVSVARGNVVLADHGLTLDPERLPPVPAPTLFRHGADDEPIPVPVRYRPTLARGPLTQAAPYDPAGAASAAFPWTPDQASPAIRLDSLPGAWTPRRDLLDSDAWARDFVVEIEADGTAQLRFGDERHGQRPDPGTAFAARYRVGNGPQGNVGAEAIATVVTEETVILAVRNPLPAQGGLAPETVAEVRRRAPFAFRRQERAVTPDDWATAARRNPGVQRAAAQVRWTGSWRTVFVAPDRLGREDATPDFLAGMRGGLERFRLAGTALRVVAPRYVPLDIGIVIFAGPQSPAGVVESRVRQEFGAGVLPDGRRGFFHPDEFSFGEPVYLSRLYGRIKSVPGVLLAFVSVFRRLEGDLAPNFVRLDQGKQPDSLPMGATEIARCDSDPDFPENGFVRVAAYTRQLAADNGK